ncbi:hypothetical protein GYMLUDRAFT_464794 [Collybiopsis luxurians FD-317 M1]|uniref:Unplaced genomic scaffold GYMLUscaffold_16, whole genome shotgun sequence n=1 Tax=Collybiopsis luxurians FD-317 M1 TaxID=944289 RepID=A0A0D0CUR8_9AGAR|nr:hypothetical protein GYMLUDRAFT_464794 [Collybiopsis luxurians FD-317 M1]
MVTHKLFRRRRRYSAKSTRSLPPAPASGLTQPTQTPNHPRASPRTSSLPSRITTHHPLFTCSTTHHPLFTCSTTDLSLITSTNDSKFLLRLAPPMSQLSSISSSMSSDDDNDGVGESGLTLDMWYAIRPPTTSSTTATLAAGDHFSRDQFLSIVGSPLSFTIP